MNEKPNFMESYRTSMDFHKVRFQPLRNNFDSKQQLFSPRPKGTYVLLPFLNGSGIPEADIFGQKRRFSAFGIRFRPPNLKAENGRKSNFKFQYIMD